MLRHFKQLISQLFTIKAKKIYYETIAEVHFMHFTLTTPKYFSLLK